MIDWKRTLIKWFAVLCCIATLELNIGTALYMAKTGQYGWFALECITALFFWELTKRLGIHFEYKDEEDEEDEEL
jgi:hypothetical protein